MKNAKRGGFPFCLCSSFGGDTGGIAMMMDTADKRVKELLQPKNDAIDAAVAAHNVLKQQYNAAVASVEAIDITDAMKQAAADMVRPDYDAYVAAARKIGARISAFEPHFEYWRLCVSYDMDPVVMDPATVPDVLKPLATAQANRETLNAKVIESRAAINTMNEERDAAFDAMMEAAHQVAIEQVTREFKGAVEGRLAEVLKALEAPKPTAEPPADGKEK
jgi:hypothetical protein